MRGGKRLWKGESAIVILLIKKYYWRMKFFAIMMTTLLICSCSSTPPVKPFTVDFRATRHEIGKVEAYFDKFLSIGGLDKNTITVYYYPKDNAVGLEYKAQLIEYCQFWSESGRDAFVRALERYEDEFEQRTLVKNVKSGSTYGSVPGFITWRKSKISITAYSKLSIRMGYQIKDAAAYFSVSQPEASYSDSEISDIKHTVPAMTIYFTRVQAESLAALFNREHLQQLRALNSTGATPAGPDLTDIDLYIEPGLIEVDSTAANPSDSMEDTEEDLPEDPMEGSTEDNPMEMDT
jgi:hypothetical protein